MKPTIDKRLAELERQIVPAEGTNVVDLGTGTLEIRWGDKLMCRVRKDLWDELLDLDTPDDSLAKVDEYR